MLRIGIVGSDNSHALEFAKLINVEQMFGNDVRVVAICGDEQERTEEVARVGNIPSIVADGRAMIGQIDAAMVVHRHADLHARNAVPLLEAGLPMFVDKPIAISLDDAHTILDTAARHNVLVTSFSALRWGPDTERFLADVSEVGALRVGVFSGPCDWASVYGGPLFYSTHTIEIMLRVCGEDVQTVQATRAGANVVATLTFADGKLVTLESAWRCRLCLSRAGDRHRGIMPRKPSASRVRSMKMYDCLWR